MKYQNLTTAQIEERYNLSDRLAAVKACVHGQAYLATTYGLAIDGVQGFELLGDGIKNALDGRATGHEWRTIRHLYNNRRDGPVPPRGRDNRCFHCGVEDPRPYTPCNDRLNHRNKIVVHAPGVPEHAFIWIGQRGIWWSQSVPDTVRYRRDPEQT